MKKTKAGTLVFDGREPEAKAAVAAAAEILQQGGLVAFPTETVYGLGANALDPQAVRRIFAAKGRPQDNPLIVHISNAAELYRLAKNIPREAWLLAERFWPGPLTLVLEKQPHVPPETTGGLDSVAVRVPRHPLTLALLSVAALPVAAPSANLSGRPSPTTAEHVLADLDGRIDAVLDGGPCDVGVESTVLDIRQGRPRILRPGGVTQEELVAALQRDCPLVSWEENNNSPPPSPGMKYLHYAPRAPLYLYKGRPEAVVQKMQEAAAREISRGRRVGLLVSAESAAFFQSGRVIVLGGRNEPHKAAAHLFAALRAFDAEGVDVILAEGFPPRGVGMALMNRLQKAAGPRVIRVE